MPGLSFVQSCIFLFHLSAWSRSETRTRTRTLRRARPKTRTRCGAMSSTSSSLSSRTTPADDKYLWLRDFLPSNTNLPSGSKSIFTSLVTNLLYCDLTLQGRPSVPTTSSYHFIPAQNSSFYGRNIFCCIILLYFISQIINIYPHQWSNVCHLVEF